ncbi:MAG: ABC transporter permease [Bacteroidales bacterium]
MNAILLTAEFKKIRHTPAIWISVVGPLIMALLIFLIFYFQGERLVKMDVNPYNKFISMGINSVIMILFPLFVVIINSLILSIEHSAQGWKMLLTAPVSRLNIYLSKWGLIQLLVFLTLLLYLFYLVFRFSARVNNNLFLSFCEERSFVKAMAQKVRGPGTSGRVRA